MMTVWLREGITIAVLVWVAVLDLRRKKLSVRELMAAAGVPVLVGLTEELEAWQRIGGLIFGVLVLCICVLSAEALGYADGIMLLSLGLKVGIVRISFISFISFFFSAVVAGGFYAAGKLGKKGRLPFLPFLLLGYLVSLAAGRASVLQAG